MRYKDYYRVLDVPRDASAEDIRRAYRRLARRYHPDVSQEIEAEERFKEINEAHEVLGDPAKRAAYDLLGDYRPGQDFQPPPEWDRRFHTGGIDPRDLGDVDISDLLSRVFRSSRGGAGDRLRGGRGQWGRRHARDIETSAVLTLEEAYHGVRRSVGIAGADAVEVDIPAGVQDGQRLRIPGMGLMGPAGRAGDLIVHIQIIPHDLYRLKGKTILLDVPITPSEAALGALLKIPTPSGRVRVKVAPGARSGQKLRLPGRGMPSPDGPGDFYAQLKIVLPPELSDEEKALYQRLGEVSGFDPRAHFPRKKAG